MTEAAQLTLLRHGKSRWNVENRFTGWADVDLAEAGQEEAAAAGRAMSAAGLRFDRAYVSNLKRAVSTLWLVLQQMDLMWIPQTSDWRLNERHYGFLQGMNKAQAAQQYGAEQIKQWRRGYAVAPPPLSEPQPLLAGVAPPGSESLKDIIPRVSGVYNEHIAPQLRQKKSVLVVAHGNSLRALVKIIENISDDNIMDLEIPTATPRLYQLDDALKPINVRMLER